MCHAVRACVFSCVSLVLLQAGNLGSQGVAFGATSLCLSCAVSVLCCVCKCVCVCMHAFSLVMLAHVQDTCPHTPTGQVAVAAAPTVAQPSRQLHFC